MQRISKNYTINNIDLFKQKILLFTKSFDISCILNNHDYKNTYFDQYTYHSYDFLAGIGAYNKLIFNEYDSHNTNVFDKLYQFFLKQKDWLFGYFSYETNYHFFYLNTTHKSNFEFPDSFFFQPQILLYIIGNKLSISAFAHNETELDIIYKNINEQKENCTNNINCKKIHKKITELDYEKDFNTIKNHIQIGDIYEINYCQELYSDAEIANPEQLFLKLGKLSPTPFSAFFKYNNQYILSASPERYLKKIGNKLISQPMKGTCQRSTNIKEDILLKQKLAQDPKEQAENVMITDLVRNDLSVTASRGSVMVEKLFGVYGFPYVYQMVSTISSQLKLNYTFSDAIKYSYPMGSMTGAPKKRAMELILNYEKSKRGLYSGSVGYITPAMDFDFNVLIRSLLHNKTTNYSSYMVGGAITANAKYKNEYAECLLKAKLFYDLLNPIDF